MKDEDKTKDQLIAELAALRKVQMEGESNQAPLKTTLEVSELLSVLDLCSDALVVYDTDLRYTYINHRAAEYLGTVPDSIIGKTNRDLPGAGADAIEPHIRKVFDTGSPVLTIHEIPLSQGIRLFETNYDPVFDPDGKVAHVVGASRDVTEDKVRAQKLAAVVEEQTRALRAADERYRAMFAHMTTGVAVYRPVDDGNDFIFEDFNEAAERITRVSRQDVVGKRLLEKFPNMDTFGLFAALQRAHRTGEPEHLPAAYYEDPVRKGRRENFVYKLPGGEIVAIFSDITARMEAEESLRESEERYRALVENLPSGILVVQDDRYVFSNPQAAELLGYSHPDLVKGLAFEDTIAEPYKDVIRERKSQVLSGTANEPAEIEVVRPDGTTISVETTSVPIMHEGQPAALIIGRDISERKRWQDSLKAGELKYRKLFDSSPVGIISVDENGTILDVNNKLLEILGSPSAEATKTINMLDFEPLKQAGISDAFRRCMNGTQSLTLEVPYTSKWGRVSELRFILTPMPDEEGYGRRCQAVIEDITDRKRAEAALLESEKRYRDLYSMVRLMCDNVPDLIWAKDMDGRFVFVNRAMCQKLLFADNTDEPIGKTDMFFAERERMRHPEDKDHHTFGEICVDSDKIVKETRTQGRFEEFGNVGGKLLYLDVSKAPFWNEQGEMIGTVGCGKDVTKEMRLREQRRCAQIALEMSEERHRAVVENALEGIFVVQDGRCVFANRRALEGMEFSLEELGGRYFLDFVHPDDRMMVAENYRRRLAGEEHTNEYEVRVITKSGAAVWTEVKVVDIDWSGSSAVLAFASDISDRKKAEEIALAAERLKAIGELSAGVAHNFNNLLQIILGCSQLALTDLELGSLWQARKNLEQIVESSKFGARTVKRLQDFARIRRGSLADRGQVFDAAGTVTEAIEMSKPWWKTRPEKDGIKIELNRYVRKGCFVKGNENELFEVFVNLIKNAAEALPDGGEIRVRTGLEDDWAVVTVTDNGVGISETNLTRVFEPFWTTKGYRGTGMGLAGSYGIIQHHNGEISVESTLGQGSSFTVRLPLTTERPKPNNSPHKEDPAFRLRILIADDIPAVVKQLENGLKSYGQTVYSASSGREAIDIFTGSPVDAIVCDLAMPEMNGRQVARTITEICDQKGIPKPFFILLTGWGGQLDDKAGMQADGIDVILEKPVDMPQLIEALETLGASAP